MDAPLKFKNNILPYASEMYGVYQPLLGWISTRAVNRLSNTKLPTGIDRLLPLVTPNFTVSNQNRNLIAGPGSGAISKEFKFEIKVGGINKYLSVNTEMIYNSFLINRLKNELLQRDPDNVPKVYEELFSDQVLKAILSTDVQSDITKYLENNKSLNTDTPQNIANFTNILTRESQIAGVLKNLLENKQYDSLKNIFLQKNTLPKIDLFKSIYNMVDPLQQNLDPLDHLDIHNLKNLSLSPIGIVHLYRQYFYEFDSFLGPPVQHVWVSPGGTVELIEVHTRKTTIERTQEQSFESIKKLEQSDDIKDELSDSIRNENQKSTKFGVTVNANAGVNLEVFTADLKTTTTYELDTSSKEAQEHTHKQNRDQSQKLSSEIRNNYKSTFKTITETTDTSSKRYVLANNTNDLVNYELRRKMRQVGVQIQDLGEALCWQTYVDKPGDQLGIAKLVHIAAPADLNNINAPAVQESPANKSVTLPEVSFHPVDIRNFTSSGLLLGFVQYYPEAGMEVLVSSISISDDLNGNYGKYKAVYDNGKHGFTVYTTEGAYDDDDSFRFVISFYLTATNDTINHVNDQNSDAQKKYDATLQRASKEALYKAAQERINLTSNIRPRPSEELREEERIIVYRNLIGSLITEPLFGIEPDNEAEMRHLLSELVNTIFDVDKMLYFVAPEWWKPHSLWHFVGKGPLGAKITDQNPQDIGLQNASDFDKRNVIGWGGNEAYRPDNYYITGDSHPAKLGSSLGWILQLDGDNLRNAFLNAPWVKAVIPIRQGREIAAINWLTQLHLEGSTGLDKKYAGPPEEISKIRVYMNRNADMLKDIDAKYSDINFTVTVKDALYYLALRIKEKMNHQMGVYSDKTGNNEVVSYLASEKVYEYGSDPLMGGFRSNVPEYNPINDPTSDQYNPSDTNYDPQKDPSNPKHNPFLIFDQWIEILPTDQVVAVKVDYDPITGRQIK